MKEQETCSDLFLTAHDAMLFAFHCHLNVFISIRELKW